MKVKLSEIAAACGGELTGGEAAGGTVVNNFATDSRECGPGLMFVPIRGERSDGHDYIPAAFANGAAAAFADHPVENPGGPLILVNDCRAALQKTAAWYRERFDMPVVGITGSVGKTTAKELTAQALSAGFRVYKTPGNHNSQVGVPITLCGLEKNYGAAVIEMGVSIPGEMARIAAVAKPTCAVMTNIGVSHMETMKTRETILLEKSRIADYLPEDGVLFINGDDDLLPRLKEESPHRVLSFGLGPRCDWRAADLKETEKGVWFTARSPGGETVELFVPAFGAHNVRNALGALAVARHFGVPAEDAARAIAVCKLPAMRQEILRAGSLTIIDDSYNASPDSARAALEVLAGRSAPRKVAVLADMLELGSYAAEGHFETGRRARENRVDLLVTIGPLAERIAAGYGPEALHFETNREAVEFLKKELLPGDAVLVKGSRGMGTDEIVAALKEWAAENA